MGQTDKIDIHGKSFEELKMVGAADTMTTTRSIMRYVSGCVTRERGRMASIIRDGKWLSPAQSHDSSLLESIHRLADMIEQVPIEGDQVVFQWRPADTKFKNGLVPATR